MTPAETLRAKLALSIFTDELFAENCYVIGRRDTRKVIVVDPGLQVTQVLDFLEVGGLSVERILVSHGHVDHLAGVPALQAATAAGVGMHPDDRAIVDFEQFGQLPFMPASFRPFLVDTELRDGMDLRFEDLLIRVLHTPGHTQGSVCFVLGLDCFSGDTLFERGIGRTDLPGGDMQKIVLSIRNVLYALPRETIVYPGHGATTTIESEMLLNPFVPG